MTSRSLRATTYAHEPTLVTARLEEHSRANRWRRAATIAGPLFAGALLSLPIPAWHLFAVPGFLVAAVVLGLRRLRQHQTLVALEGPCPACGAEVSFPAPSGELRPPVTLRCPACAEFVKLEAAD